MNCTRRSAGSGLGAAVAAGLSVVIAGAMTPARAHDPVDINVSFNKEIVRIMQRKCEPCHAPGALSIPLTDYRDVRPWGRAIREELVEHRMPPAIVARGYGLYESDPGLNIREMETMLVWLDGGMPRGDDADRPAAPAAAHRHADPPASVTIALPPQTVPAREALVVRRVTVDAGAAMGRTIARVELQPGNRTVLRGARVFAEAPARTGPNVPRWLGAWLPWQHTIAPPATHAFQVPAGGRFVVELSYRGADAEQVDRSVLAVTLAGDTPLGRVDDVVVAATSQSAGQARGRVSLREATTIWALYPVLDASVTSMELRAEHPDGAVDVLMWIPRARHEWPVALVMRQPLALPAGSSLSLSAETAGSTAAAPPRVALSVLRATPPSR